MQSRRVLDGISSPVHILLRLLVLLLPAGSKLKAYSRTEKLDRGWQNSGEQAETH